MKLCSRAEALPKLTPHHSFCFFVPPAVLLQTVGGGRVFGSAVGRLYDRWLHA